FAVLPALFICRLPPAAPLFPHDALPISQSDAGFLALLRGNGQALEGIFTLGLGSRDHGPDGGTQAHGGAPPLLVIQTLGSTAHQDRKSTRLNSSHVKISYAVFCLKKKKE